MRMCRTCHSPLWICYLVMGWPFQKRIKPFKDANDCTELLPWKVGFKIWQETQNEVYGRAVQGE